MRASSVQLQTGGERRGWYSPALKLHASPLDSFRGLGPHSSACARAGCSVSCCGSSAWAHERRATLTGALLRALSSPWVQLFRLWSLGLALKAPWRACSSLRWVSGGVRNADCWSAAAASPLPRFRAFYFSAVSISSPNSECISLSCDLEATCAVRAAIIRRLASRTRSCRVRRGAPFCPQTS